MKETESIMNMNIDYEISFETDIEKYEIDYNNLVLSLVIFSFKNSKDWKDGKIFWKV